jgi:hypothetical protein
MPVTQPTERARRAIAQLRDRIGQPAVELAASG